MAKKTQNETTAPTKWPILWNIVGKMTINKHKRNHRAQEMADFMQKCRKNEHRKTQTKPPRSRNGRFYGKWSENEHQNTQNETTALKKWLILWKIVFFWAK